MLTEHDRVLFELETPKNCGECPFSYETEGVSHDYCKYSGYETDISDFTGRQCTDRPRWCPFNFAKSATLGQEVSVGLMSQTMEQECLWVSLDK